MLKLLLGNLTVEKVILEVDLAVMNVKASTGVNECVKFKED